MTQIITELNLSEISAVDKPAQEHALARIAKKEDGMSMEDEIKKALAPNDNDSEREAGRKALIAKQLKAGVLTTTAFAAELVIEKKAEELRKVDRTLSPAAAYAAALADPANADLVRALYS